MYVLAPLAAFVGVLVGGVGEWLCVWLGVCVWVGGVNHVSRQFVCTCMVYGVV